MNSIRREDRIKPRVGLISFLLTLALMIATPVFLLNNNTYQVAIPILVIVGLGNIALITWSFTRGEKRGFAITSLLLILLVPALPILVVMTVWFFGT